MTFTAPLSVRREYVQLPPGELQRLVDSSSGDWKPCVNGIAMLVVSMPFAIIFALAFAFRSELASLALGFRVGAFIVLLLVLWQVPRAIHRATRATAARRIQAAAFRQFLKERSHLDG